jgi:ATP-dependent Lhr-like helicase
MSPGEQYGLPEAIGLLRKTSRDAAADQWVSVSGADPRNLAGILAPAPRLAALTGNRIVYRDGLPIAVLSGGDVQFLVALHSMEAQKRLLRSATPTLMADLG